ncbi:MAG: ArsR/SmtB family transcription factor [Promethearchaeota archaeon]
MESVQDYTSIKQDKINLLIGDELVKISKALSSPTRQLILKFLSNGPLDISAIAKKLNQTEANSSAQLAILQKAGLVDSRYEPGNHGVRKICELRYNSIEINLESA